ncbi:MAG: hypothetical protein KDI78_01850 [Xanthomonadales bacterium]|nr:hypothetical protein [Xanthomonadales bacterium]
MKGVGMQIKGRGGASRFVIACWAGVAMWVLSHSLQGMLVMWMDGDASGVVSELIESVFDVVVLGLAPLPGLVTGLLTPWRPALAGLVVALLSIVLAYLYILLASVGFGGFALETLLTLLVVDILFVAVTVVCAVVAFKLRPTSQANVHAT